jgi:murein DD-endopeptidase MepM/ murein hydrolase activator NlpD
VGEMGSSGSSLFPHLHYELATGPDMKAEGLPSTFRNLDRVMGAKRVGMDGVSPDSGDILADRSVVLGR